MANHVKIPKDMYLKAYRYELFPTEDQIQFLDKCFNMKRYIWNWALEKENEQLEKHKVDNTQPNFLNMYALDAEFTKLRNENEFVQEVPHNTGRSAIRSLMKSFQYYFYGYNRRPKFKTKKLDVNPSFKTREDRMFFDGNQLRIEGLPKDDTISLKTNTGYSKESKSNQKYYNAVISKDNLGRYWISYNILAPKPLTYFEDHNIPETEVVGVDINMQFRCVLSTGEKFESPNINRIEKHIQEIHSHVCRDTERCRNQHPEIANLDLDKLDLPISKRAKKRVIKYRKLNKKVHDIEINNINNIACKIVNKRPKMIVLEDLANEKSTWPHYMQRQLTHFNHYTMRKAIERKADLFGVPVKIAPKKYPSSQICSSCGKLKNIGSRKTYICDNCGLRIDRDVNAAINLAKLAL